LVVIRASGGSPICGRGDSHAHQVCGLAVIRPVSGGRNRARRAHRFSVIARAREDATRNRAVGRDIGSIARVAPAQW
jgi:hypothetical protein